MVIGNYYVNYQNYQNLMLLTSSDTKGTLQMHLFHSKRTGFKFQCVHKANTTAINWHYTLGSMGLG